ncbi:MAG: hypothetical protein ACREMW_07030 [Gemmatimonadales bacterium]
MSLDVAREALAEFLAGRAKPERVVAAVAEACYRRGARGDSVRAGLRPVLDVIERAAPGVVALARTEGGAGFDIRLAERPFPREYEAELRQAAAAALAGIGGRVAVETAPGGEPGLLGRMLRAVRRLFSAST